MLTEDLSPTLRLQLARAIKRARKNERELAIRNDARYAFKRNRSFKTYLAFLVGLGATLEYVKKLPSPLLVDLGAGTGRALHELEQSELGKGLTLMGTGLLWDKSQVFKNYRVTSAELMRGFGPNSVGAFLSVFGPIHYSDHLDLILKRIDEILVSGGVAKFALMIRSSVTPTRDVYHQYVLNTLQDFFRSREYGLGQQEKTIDREDWSVTYRALLVVKGDPENLIAQSLVEKDQETFPHDIDPSEFR